MHDSNRQAAMTSLEQCAYRHPQMGPCDEPAVGWFVIDAAYQVPEPAAEVGLDKPMRLCQEHAQMYHGHRVEDPR